MHFSVRSLMISIIYNIFNAQAGPENLFTSDSSVLDTDAYLDNDSQWSSNELISSVPDLVMNPLAQDSTITNNDEDLFTDFPDSSLTTNPPETLFLSSACNNQGSLTVDPLQARDEASSCSDQKPPQAGLKLPDIYDANFLPQGLGSAAAGNSDSPDEGSGSEKTFLDENYFSPAIPEAFRLEENLGLCPPEIFRESTTPVCNNPVTGRIEDGNVYVGATGLDPGFDWIVMLNVIPCMFFGGSCFAPVFLWLRGCWPSWNPDTPLCPLDEVWCCSIIEARVSVRNLASLSIDKIYWIDLV